MLLTTSCTDALEMTSLMLDIGPGDTVIVPSFTFTTTALAYARQGATIRFADIEPTTLGIDPAQVDRLLDDSRPGRRGGPLRRHRLRPRRPDRGACSPTRRHPHRGQRSRPLRLVPRPPARARSADSRRSVSTRRRTSRAAKAARCSSTIRPTSTVPTSCYDKGTNRRAFMLGDVDKYSWQDTGSSFGMSDILAAYPARAARAIRQHPRATGRDLPSRTAAPSSPTPNASASPCRSSRLTRAPLITCSTC